MDNKIEWTRLKHGQWDLYISVTEKGLCYVGTQNEDFEDLKSWVKKRLPGYLLIEEDKTLQGYITELIEFLDGKRQEFTAAVALHGTAFQQSVWQALLEIPYMVKQFRIRRLQSVSEIQRPCAPLDQQSVPIRY